jgi:diguanylate cyclase (GGDEF)-like protein/PAS domain S-box-containing protein
MGKASEKILQTLSLQECKGLMYSIFLNAPIPMWISQRGRFQMVNPSMIEDLGFSEEELLNMHPLDPVHPEDREKVREAALAMLRGERLEPYEFRIITKSGEIQWCIGNVTSINFRGEKGVIGYFMNITYKKCLEEELIQEKRNLSLMLEGIPAGAYLITPERKIFRQNQSAERLFSSKVGQFCWEGIHKLKFISEEQREFYLKTGTPLPGTKCYFCQADEALREKEPKRDLIKLEDTFWEVWWVPLDENLYLHYAMDVTYYKKLEEELYQLSITDPLTGIYNRRYFLQRLEEEIERVKRGGHTFSLTLFDLDNFKAFNDTYGHQAGDRALQFVVDVVRRRLRKIDLFARFGGEEFTILFPNTFLKDAARVCEELRKKLEGSETLLPRLITASFGVTEYREGDTSDSILKRADELMYEAKRRGKNQVVGN